MPPWPCWAGFCACPEFDCADALPGAGGSCAEIADGAARTKSKRTRSLPVAHWLPEPKARCRSGLVSRLDERWSRRSRRGAVNTVGGPWRNRFSVRSRKNRLYISSMMTHPSVRRPAKKPPRQRGLFLCIARNYFILPLASMVMPVGPAFFLASTSLRVPMASVRHLSASARSSFTSAGCP